MAQPTRTQEEPEISIPVLIAEPDPIYTEYLVRLLSQLGYRPIVVDEATDFILCAIRGNASVLMLELRLADMRGVDVMRIIREVRPELPLIVMSHDNSQKIEAEARSIGFFYYLLKPFGVGEVSDALSAAVTYWKQ